MGNEFEIGAASGVVMQEALAPLSKMQRFAVLTVFMGASGGNLNNRAHRSLFTSSMWQLIDAAGFVSRGEFFSVLRTACTVLALASCAPARDAAGGAVREWQRAMLDIAEAALAHNAPLIERAQRARNDARGAA